MPNAKKLPVVTDSQRLCVQCKFCNWDRIDADGPQWPYCANPTTKEFAPPIYFLHAESLKCPEF